MRSLLYKIFLPILVIGTLSGYTKHVLLEEVTNNGCPSCPPADAEFDTIIARHGSSGVYGIKYHAWWPNSSDPFYLYNMSENRARINYYGVNYTPHLFVNGNIDGRYQYSTWENLTLNELGSVTPINLTLEINYDDAHRTGYMITTIEADRAVNYNNLKLRYAIVESNIHFTSPNGERVHNYVFRDMLPNVNGTPISIDSGQIVVDTQAFTVDTLWVIPNCEFLVFLQDDNTKAILQVTGSHITINHPNLYVAGLRVDDSAGNNNGRVEPGENANIIITIADENYYQDANNVTAYLSTTDPSVNVVDSVSSYPDIPSGSSADNSSDPFVINVSSTAEVHIASFNLHIEAQNYTIDIPISLEIGFPQLIVIDDDEGDNYEDFIYPNLDSILTIYDRWDQASEGNVTADWLANYPYVLWFTGNSTTNSLTSGEINVLTAYLNQGGNLFITGQNIAENLAGNSFLSNYLHASFVAPNFAGIFINGVNGDPIGNNLSLVTSGPNSAMNQTSKDVIQPTADAYPVFTYNGYTDSIAGVRYSGAYKVVFFSFGIEGLGELPPTYTGRTVVLRRVLQWLGLNVGVSEHISPSQILTISAFPNPFSNRLSFLTPSDIKSGKIRILDVSGRLVREIPIKNGHAEWDGRDKYGKPAPQGIYFYGLNKTIEGKVIKLR